MPPRTATKDLPPARMAAEDRRRQLIDVAVDLFSKRGFSGTTTKQIAAAAGVTEAMIFRHFATKEQLYTAILDQRLHAAGAPEWIADTHACMQRNDDEGLVRRLIAIILQTTREDPKFERVMLYAALEGHQLAAMYHQRLAVPVSDPMRKYFARRQKEGALRKANPDLMIMAVAGMAQIYATHRYMCKYKDVNAGEEEAVDTFTRIVMDGLRADGKKKGKR